MTRLVAIWVCLVIAAMAVSAPAQQTAAGSGLAASILSVYTPPACVPGVPFADVTCTTGFDPWIEQLALDGITAGCGNGNYCPGTPVTRDQMAVFLEKAMRGTSNWPPHTVLAFHHPAAEANSDVNSGTELLALVAAIPTSGTEAPSATNPWLIRVGPGIFDLGTGSLTLPAYTALEGAGQDITVITATAPAGGSQGTVVPGDHDRLSRVTVNSVGGNSTGLAVHLPPTATNVGLEHVALVASGSSGSLNGALCLGAESGASFFMVDCDLTAHGAQNNKGVLATASIGECRLDAVRINVYGGTDQDWAVSVFDTPLVVTNSRFDVSDGSDQRGIDAVGGSLAVRDSEIHVQGLGYGILTLDLPVTLLGDVITTPGWGVHLVGTGAAEIDHCDVEGGSVSIWVSLSYVATVGASKLVGATASIGATLNCFGNYTNSAFLPNTCP